MSVSRCVYNFCRSFFHPLSYFTFCIIHCFLPFFHIRDSVFLPFCLLSAFPPFCQVLFFCLFLSFSLPSLTFFHSGSISPSSFLSVSCYQFLILSVSFSLPFYLHYLLFPVSLSLYFMFLHTFSFLLCDFLCPTSFLSAYLSLLSPSLWATCPTRSIVTSSSYLSGPPFFPLIRFTHLTEFRPCKTASSNVHCSTQLICWIKRMRCLVPTQLACRAGHWLTKLISIRRQGSMRLAY